MKSIELPQLSSLGSCEHSVCERCGEPFSCGAQASACWCAEVTLSDALRGRLREQYKGCLCRTCLEQFARAEAGAGANRAEKIFS